MSAGADEQDAPPPAASTPVDESDLGPASPGLETPPPLLPWGEEPEPLKVGAAAATSEALAASGAEIAPATRAKQRRSKASWRPKGSASGIDNYRTRSVDPAPPLSGPLTVDTKLDTTAAFYHYGVASQTVENYGSFANVIIGKPYLGSTDHHSLAELAIRSPDKQQIVEVGWTVDYDQFGDFDPHLFVFHWVDGKSRCYNACGWVDYSKNVDVGDTLAAGDRINLGFMLYNNSWWVLLGKEWIGYFPGSIWDGKFTRGDQIQWYGEVASTVACPTSQMGTGAALPSNAAGRFGSISLVNKDGSERYAAVEASAVSQSRREKIPVAPQYGVYQASATTVQYGGGQPCKDPSPRPGQEQPDTPATGGK